MVEATLETEKATCPRCGAFGFRDARSGFCERCNTELGLCVDCGNFVGTSLHRKRCRRCNLLLWLQENADQIESVMAVYGLTSYKAIMVLREGYGDRYTCSCCGEDMQSPSHGVSVGFCTKNRRCRTAHNRMRHLLYVKRVPHNIALKQVLGEME